MIKTEALTTTPTREFWAGARATIPMIVGAFPFGVIFGAVAVTNGMSTLGALGMSLFVFAGSAQFIGVTLIAAGATTPVIILTTFVVNLRHALYSTTLAPRVKHLSRRWLLPLGFLLTDEAFFTVINRYNQPDDSPYKHWFFIGSELTMYVTWQIFTLLGIITASAVDGDQLQSLGLDFALIATFIGMLIPSIKNRPIFVAALVGGAVAVLTYSMPNKIGLIVAALCGVLAGVLVENLQPESKKEERLNA